MKTFLLGLALILSSGPSVASDVRASSKSGSSANVHTLSLKVQRGEDVLISGTVQALPDHLGTLGVSGPKDEGWQFRFTISEIERGTAGAPLVELDSAVYEGNGESAKLLATPRMTYRLGSAPSVQIGPDDSAIRVTVLSHSVATIEMSDALVGKLSRSCKISDSSGKSQGPCCSARCNDGSNFSLRCCGVVSCCACAACCSTP